MTLIELVITMSIIVFVSGVSIQHVVQNTNDIDGLFLYHSAYIALQESSTLSLFYTKTQLLGIGTQHVQSVNVQNQQHGLLFNHHADLTNCSVNNSTSKHVELFLGQQQTKDVIACGHNKREVRI